MNIAFRVDASLKMGTGHLMRCLTLGDALKAKGHHCHFITRDHPGSLNDAILRSGHSLTILPAPITNWVAAETTLAHEDWLGASWQEDAKQTVQHLAGQPVDWLIVDHYALDQRWESILAEHTARLMVIDDLADRNHHCHLLLDQSLGRKQEDYFSRVMPGCTLLFGPQFALLRSEFAELRQSSLTRRQDRPVRNLLISMGGVDAPNATGHVLAALQNNVPTEWTIKIVMGATAPWCEEVQLMARTMRCPTEVLVNTPQMAALMSDADIAIGAAGSTAWERCCLGLPSIMLVLADNQREIASQLKAVGAATVINSFDQISTNLLTEINRLSSPNQLKQMSGAAQLITDGQGVGRVVDILTQRAVSHGKTQTPD